MLIYVIYLLTGMLGGIIIGALGSGSSLIVLPLLSLVFHNIFPETISLKIAVGTCMATLIVGSISGTISYARAKLYDLRLVKLSLPGIILGAVTAPLTAHLLSAHWLRLYIGVLLITIAVYEVAKGLQRSRRQKSTGEAGETFRAPEPLVIFLVSAVCTTLSGMAGVALGILMIPFLSRYASHKTVVGTNLILAVPYTIIGTIGYIVAGIQAHLPETGTLMVGYVYLPAFLAIAATMGFFPPVGLRLVKNLGATLTERLFYIYLLIIGITILL